MKQDAPIPTDSSSLWRDEDAPGLPVEYMPVLAGRRHPCRAVVMSHPQPIDGPFPFDLVHCLSWSGIGNDSVCRPAISFGHTQGKRSPASPAPDNECPVYKLRRTVSSRRGTVLFEALLAVIILTLSILAFFSLFATNTTRMAKAQKERNAAIFADSVLSTLRAVSDEQARQTNWLGFWTNFLSDATPGTVIATAFPDAWSNQFQITDGFLIANPSPPGWMTANPWATNAGTLRFAAPTPNTAWTTGTVNTIRSGWYRRQLGTEATINELFGQNERYPNSQATTRRSVLRYQLSAHFMINSIALTNAVAVSIDVWPGETGDTNTINRVRMYAEFWDTGSL